MSELDLAKTGCSEPLESLCMRLFRAQRADIEAVGTHCTGQRLIVEVSRVCQSDHRRSWVKLERSERNLRPIGQDRSARETFLSCECRPWIDNDDVVSDAIGKVG